MPSPLSRAESRITAASIACLLILTYLVVWSAASFGDLRGVRFGTSFVDFDAFYLSGRMVWSGTIAKAYAMSTMFAAEMAEGGTTPHLPWTYPPQFNLLTALLVLLPKGLAYLAFIGTSFMAYLYLLRRLAGPQVHRVVILTMPAMMISILIGQNGLLTGALIGAFALASLSGARIAGIPLGLMAIKPHLALGVGLWTLVSGSWRVTVIAAVTLLATLALTTLILGPGIWPAFLAGVHESGTLLASGFYQMTRMTSLYSTAITLGLPHAVAFGLQIALAIAACALIVWAALRHWPLRQQLGLALLLSLCFSPYLYDYDMAILGIAAAVLAADITARATGLQQVLILVLAWLSTGWWVTASYFSAIGVTVSGLAYGTLIALTLTILRRAPAFKPAAAPAF